MNDEEIDRLFGEPEIVPSSGFANRVMAAVRQEVAAPPPIPFPWARALPGIVLCAVGLIIAFVYAAGQPHVSNESGWSIPWPHVDVSGMVQFGNMSGLGWVGLSLALTFVAAVWSMRFARRRA